MPTQVSVRSSSRVSRSQSSSFLTAVSGSARYAATATVNELTMAKTTAQPIAASMTGGRVSQAREPVAEKKSVLGDDQVEHGRRGGPGQAERGRAEHPAVGRHPPGA